MTCKRKKGFGLLEVLLAGVIIIIVLSALMVVARNAVDNSVLLQQRAQATYLAQEWIELVRQARDTNYVDGGEKTKWNTLIGLNSDDPIAYENEYVVSEDKTLHDDRIKIAEPVINNLNMDGIVNIDGTEFTRKVVFSRASGSLATAGSELEHEGSQVTNQSFKVKVTVEWKSKNADKKIEIETLLTNSRQGF